jgi:septal ring factor EnvC (AmiA/AmiB activator)
MLEAPLDAFGQPILLERRRRTTVMLASFTAIAVMALAAACYLWFNYDRSIEPGSSGAAAAGRAAEPGAGVTLQNLQAALQQTTSELEAMKQNIAASEAEHQKLSDQVSALATRVDALQNAHPSPSTSGIARQPSKKPTQTLRPAPN